MGGNEVGCERGFRMGWVQVDHNGLAGRLIEGLIGRWVGWKVDWWLVGKWDGWKVGWMESGLV